VLLLLLAALLLVVVVMVPVAWQLCQSWEEGRLRLPGASCSPTHCRLPAVPA
jgi:hypothetical protein